MTPDQIKTFVDTYGWYGLAIAASILAVPRVFALIEKVIIPAWLALLERRTAAAERQAQAMVDIAELCRASRGDWAEAKDHVVSIAAGVAVLLDRVERPAEPQPAPSRRLKVEGSRS